MAIHDEKESGKLVRMGFLELCLCQPTACPDNLGYDYGWIQDFGSTLENSFGVDRVCCEKHEGERVGCAVSIS